jgi:hypothetical protein
MLGNTTMKPLHTINICSARERERERERQTDRQTDRKRERRFQLPLVAMEWNGGA